SSRMPRPFRGLEGRHRVPVRTPHESCEHCHALSALLSVLSPSQRRPPPSAAGHEPSLPDVRLGQPGPELVHQTTARARYRGSDFSDLAWRPPSQLSQVKKPECNSE